MRYDQTAEQVARELAQRAFKRGFPVLFDLDEAIALVRAERVLHRWHELECGDGNDYASFGIERDEKTGIPYMVTHHHHAASPSRHRIPDREAGALKRVKAICETKGLHYWQQTDPRGCALYISQEPLTDSNYTNGLAVC